MKKIIISLCLFIASSMMINAQNVVRKGNVFEVQTERKESKKSEPVNTGLIYRDSKGKEYPIYLSSKGKAFIIKTSKNTGKEYRQYLPKVTEQLNNPKKEN